MGVTDGPGPGVGRVEVTEDASGSRGVTFAGDTGDLPVAAPVVLGRFAERYPVDDIPPGTALATFRAGDLDTLEPVLVSEVRAARR